MNNLEEIKFQNKFDYFAKMYGFIARSMMEAGGKRGERAVREAVIRYGRDLGEGIRKAYLELGKKTNLHTLFQMEPCCGTDPRFKRNRGGTASRGVSLPSGRGLEKRGLYRGGQMLL